MLRTAANLHLLFRGQMRLLTVGYTLPEMALSVDRKLELLSELCLCQTSIYSRIRPRMYTCRLPCITWATYKHMTMYVYYSII